jgi:hypothetical protein
MQQKDYILREIEKIGAMLRMIIRRLFEWKENEEQEEKLEQFASGLALESNVELENLLKLKKEDFSEYFDENKGFNAVNIELLADLFAHLSDIAESEKAIQYKMKAIELYNYIDETGRTFSMERANKLKKLNPDLFLGGTN